MKNKKFIIGFISLTVFLLSSAKVHADICSTKNVNNSYMKTYCQMRLHSNEQVDSRLVNFLASQYDTSDKIIEGVLAGNICETIADYKDEDAIKKLPLFVQNACQTSRKTTGEVFGAGWNTFTDIRNSYEKEKVLRHNAMSLEFKLKASEQYWDGKVGGVTNPNDAPFDLIVDLNLIEIVLFGSKAQWMNDVFAFPKDDEDDSTGADAPMDEAKPSEDEDDKSKEPSLPGQSGVTTSTEDEDGKTPDCVLPDDPEADLGDGPGSDHKNPLCGNGTIDILMGETCDDGNTDSGDGCNQYCQLEETGSNDICIDPEAVTFKTPEEAYGNEGDGNEGDGNDGSGSATGQSECPPGTVPKKSTDTTGDEASGLTEVPQSPEYPGPFLGGTMKQFPTSQKPPCPEGFFNASGDVGTASGDETLGINVAGNQYDIPRCLPTEFCMDPDITRDFLASTVFGIGKGIWKTLGADDVRKQSIESIESLFCVNLIKANRPLSPYSLTEGCVDCHITAMADSLEKALQTNVTPLANTTSAFEISSKWGPSYSFNLSTAIKGKPKNFFTETGMTPIQKANEKALQSQLDNSGQALVIPQQSPLNILAQEVADSQQKTENIKEDTKLYQMSSSMISEQEVNSRIKPLILQMRDSFRRIQSKYHSMSYSTTIDKIPQCQ